MHQTELLARLPHLALVARELGGGLLARPMVRLPAGGTEVTGHRDYAPGDDYRMVDWPICARHDELRVRQYQGEADRHVYFLVDCSRSMTLGRPTKLAVARQTAASLAFVALADQQRVHLAGFSKRIVATFGPLGDKNRIADAMRFLEELVAQDTPTDLAGAAAQLVGRRQRPGLAVVISDFWDPAGFDRGLDILRWAGYPPRVVRIDASQDTEVERLGDVELSDVETQSVCQAVLTERHLAAYRRLVAEHREALRRYCTRYRLGYVQLSTTLADEELLLRAIGAKRASCL